MEQKIILILCGEGTRLWPLFKTKVIKTILALFGDDNKSFATNSKIRISCLKALLNQ